MIVGTLGELFTMHGSDKDTHHSYGPFYEELLSPHRDRLRRILEIGVYKGASLLAWADWLPNAHIAGVDNWSGVPLPGWEGGTEPPKIEKPRVRLITADATDPADLYRQTVGGSFYDLIIDDGSHQPIHQATTFGTLWPMLAPGGFYVIEDVWTIEIARAFEKQLNGQVIDRREVKGRGDDILVVWQKPPGRNRT